MIYAVLDPGKTTGFVTHGPATDWFTAREMDFDTTCRELLYLGNKYGADLTIICESFIIGAHTAKNTQAPWSLELIGVARAVSRVWTGKDVALQSPATAKHFSSDERLKLMGWYTPRKGHANDAARHLLVYLATHGLLSSDKLKSLVSVVE